MAEFKKLSEVEQIETASDNATVLVEENGEIKRVPKKEVGGGGAIATAIIRSFDYLDAIEGAKHGGIIDSTLNYETTYECLNMTFEEAYQIMESGEPLMIVFMTIFDGIPASTYVMAGFAGTAFGGDPCISVMVLNAGEISRFFWTADGISTTGGVE